MLVKVRNDNIVIINQEYELIEVVWAEYMYFARSAPLQHVSKPKQIEQLFYIQLVKIFIFPTISKIESYISTCYLFFNAYKIW